jgi:hypothetical protein
MAAACRAGAEPVRQRARAVAAEMAGMAPVGSVVAKLEALVA